LFELGETFQQFIANEVFHHWVTRRLFQIDYPSSYPTDDPVQGEQKDFSYRLRFKPVERLIAVAADNDREALSLYCALTNERKQDCVPSTTNIVPSQHGTLIPPARRLLEWLYIMHKQPLLLSCSFHNLRTFIDGYLLCYQDHNQQPKDAIDFEAFGKWLQ